MIIATSNKIDRMIIAESDEVERRSRDGMPFGHRCNSRITVGFRMTG